MVRYFIFLGFKITPDGDGSHEIKRSLIPGRKAMTNLDSMLKKQIHYFANKGLYSQSYGSSSESEVKVAQSCLTLCDPMDYTVLGLLQARVLEWVAIPFSKESSQPRD